MRIGNGKIAEDRIIVEGEALAESAEVTVLCADEPEFELNDADEAALIRAVGEAGRGETLECCRGAVPISALMARP